MINHYLLNCFDAAAKDYGIRVGFSNKIHKWMISLELIDNKSAFTYHFNSFEKKKSLILNIYQNEKYRNLCRNTIYANSLFWYIFEWNNFFMLHFCYFSSKSSKKTILNGVSKLRDRFLLCTKRTN